MGANPTPVVAFLILSRLLIAFLNGTSFLQEEVPTCDDFFDFLLGGCAGFLGFLSGLAFGTVLGAPVEINSILLAIGVVIDFYVIFAIVQLVRGI